MNSVLFYFCMAKKTYTLDPTVESRAWFPRRKGRRVSPCPVQQHLQSGHLIIYHVQSLLDPDTNPMNKK